MVSARFLSTLIICLLALQEAACKKTSAPAQAQPQLTAQRAAASPPAAPQPPTKETVQVQQDIRNVNLEEFVKAHLSELNPDLADLGTVCGEGQKPLQSMAPARYGDADGDGQEEAAVEGWSCVSGNGGPDIFAVLKLLQDGTIAVLPIDPMPKLFKGRNPAENLRGHMGLEIKNGRLLEIFPLYPNEKACNNCSEGERRFIYSWDGQRFVLDDIIDAPENPPAKSGS